MDALDRAFVSKVEERQKRALEIGNELLQHPPSSKEELLEKLDAMGLFSNTKESNSLKTSKEQHERKTSPSQKEALSSVSITKKINFPEISKVQLKCLPITRRGRLFALLIHITNQGKRKRL